MENKNTQNMFSNIKYTFPNVVLTINMFIKCMLETSQTHLTMIVKYLSTFSQWYENTLGNTDI